MSVNLLPVCAVLLGVQEEQLRDETFQTKMERKLAQLISEATLQKRRWKRASYAGSNTVQVTLAKIHSPYLSLGGKHYNCCRKLSLGKKK